MVWYDMVWYGMGYGSMAAPQVRGPSETKWVHILYLILLIDSPDIALYVTGPQGGFNAEQFSLKLVQPKRSSLHQPGRRSTGPRVVRERFLSGLSGELD